MISHFHIDFETYFHLKKIKTKKFFDYQLFQKKLLKTKFKYLKIQKVF
jgi:hypothetical protein